VGRITSLLAIALLPGCASFQAAPYPEYMLKEADKYIASIEYKPLEDIQSIHCTGTSPSHPNTKAGGCVKFDHKTKTAKIFISFDAAPHWIACAVVHERSHVYDVFVKGVDNTVMAEILTAFHQDWIVSSC
jgi:hypothetical protein